ncbi:MAG TPA: NADPH-dependent assimilatory sulfite reductase hemoprotein subunit [Gemmatimonadaceae bacterium]|nr:NADPH-dependent assimilatory sulfite reductase hemoprotein subunit [Gemmatimonadaceae bacterium]
MATRHGEPSGVEDIKAASDGLRGSIGDELGDGGTHFSETGRQLLKFHGAYEQDDRDERRARKDVGGEPAYSFMVRAKLPGGVLTGRQYQVFDALAGRYGNGTLRITTRQDFQLHGVIKGELKPAIAAINAALVTTLGACGDVVRNVIACPAPIEDPLRAEVLAIAGRLSAHLLPSTRAYHEIWLDGERIPDAGDERPIDPLYGTRYLPRKFKIGFGFPDDNCSDVHSNDLGFLTLRTGNALEGFDVLVGGGLGATHGKPETYPRLASPLAFVRREELCRVSEAVVAVHRDYGDRSNRRHARLKYVIDDHGLPWFRARVEEAVGHELEPPRNVDVTDIHDHLGWHRQEDGWWFYGMYVENGRIRDTEATRWRTALRDIVTRVRPEVGVRLTPQQNVLITGIDERRRPLVERILADHGVPEAARLTPVRRWAMACPALPTCGLALAESERALPDVLTSLERELERLGIPDAHLTVRMTGCPNGCARPYTADLAFVGRSADRYTVYVGGTMLGTRLGVQYADLVRRADLVAVLLPLLERYRAERLPNENFGDYVHRVGVEPVGARARAER